MGKMTDVDIAFREAALSATGSEDTARFVPGDVQVYIAGLNRNSARRLVTVLFQLHDAVEGYSVLEDYFEHEYGNLIILDFIATKYPDLFPYRAQRIRLQGSPKEA